MHHSRLWLKLNTVRHQYQHVEVRCDLGAVLTAGTEYDVSSVSISGITKTEHKTRVFLPNVTYRIVHAVFC